MRRSLIAALALAVVASLAAAPTVAATVYENGFETSTEGWSGRGSSSIERRASGATAEAYANGITSLAGGFHARLRTGVCDPAITCSGPRTSWGADPAALPMGGAITEVAVYLDTAWAASNPDARFDWTVAVGTPGGTHIQDHAFNAGTHPGGQPSFVISASDNAGRRNSYPSNPGRNPITIGASGWYVLRHVFRSNGAGMAVDLTVRTAGGTVIGSWSHVVTSGGSPVPRSNIGSLVYGMFFNQEIPGLAIDASVARDLRPAISGQSNRVVRTTSVQVLGTGEPTVTVELREGTSVLASLVPDANGNWSTLLTLTEGVHTLRAYSVLSGWESFPSAPVTITVDLTPPGIPSITRPADGAIVPVRLTISGTSEPGATVVVRESGRVLVSPVTDSTGNWSAILELLDGTHTITAQAIDIAGHTSAESAGRTFVVDAKPPQAEVQAPAPNSVSPPGVPLEIKGIATDDRAVASVRVEVLTATGALVRSGFAVCAGCPDARVDWTYAPGTLAPGLYTVRAYAHDRAGNPSTAATTSFVLLV